MRVVMLSKALVVGAYQTKAQALASEPDIELFVIVPPYWREGRHRLTLETPHPPKGYEMIVAPMAFNGAYHFHFYPTLGRLLRHLRPDLVHIDEEPYNLATFLALRAAQAVGARSLFFAWQNIHRRYPPPFCWLEAHVLTEAQGAIAGNHDAAQILRAKGYAGPLRIIPQFGVDPTLFRPPESPRPDRPFTIGYAGRLVEEKGLFVLIEAVARLKGPWRLVIYGEGPLREALHAHCERLGLAERVAFQGRIASTAMPQMLASLDALVLPSLTRPNWKEQFGRVLIEAMACEVPVIGSDSGEIPHVIGNAGLIVPEGDPQTLAEALERLRADTSWARTLGKRGRERVLALYTQAKVAAQTAQFYREIMALSV